MRQIYFQVFLYCLYSSILLVFYILSHFFAFAFNKMRQFERVNDIHGGNGLSFGVLSVGHSIPYYVLKEDFEDSATYLWSYEHKRFSLIFIDRKNHE